MLGYTRLFLAVLVFFCTKTVFAQGDFCATNRLIDAQPGLRLKMAENDVRLLAKAQKNNAKSNDSATVYTIPVVLHTVENQDGDGHADDSLLLQTIAQLNRAFANQSPYFNPNGVDTRIRFCVAQRTPTGDTTNGIVRIVSRFTYHDPPEEDDSLKMGQWNSRNYLNIWVVKDIVGWKTGVQILGYATPPAEHGEKYDGLVIVSASLGQNPSKIAVLAHEVGHYLGLYHTFQGGCFNNDCTINGDHVCDTPPDRTEYGALANNSCNTDADSPNSPFQTDVNDFTRNFMDYTDFSQILSFTKGQTARMRNTLTEIRQTLLESKGCSRPCSTPISATIQTNANTTVPVGTSLSFSTTAGLAKYEWRINSQKISDTDSLVFTPSQTGDYQIVLHVESDTVCICAANDSFNIMAVCGNGIPPLSVTIDNFTRTVTFTSGLTQGVWTVNNGIYDTVFGNGNIASYTAPTDGVFTFCVRDEATPCKLPYCRTVTIGTPPPPPPITYCPDKALILNNTNQNYLQTGVYDAASLTTFWGGREGKLNPSALIVQMDTCNAILWAKKYWSGAAANIITLHQLPDGNLLFLGSDDATHYYIGKINAQDGNLIWSQRVKTSSAMQVQEMKRIFKNGNTETFMVLYQTKNGAVGLQRWNDSGSLLGATETTSTDFRLSANALTAIMQDDIAVVGSAKSTTTPNALSQPFVLHFNPDTQQSNFVVYDAAAQSGAYTDVVPMTGGGLVVAGQQRILPNRFSQNTLSFINTQGYIVSSKTRLNTTSTVIGSRLAKDESGNLLWFSVNEAGLAQATSLTILKRDLSVLTTQNLLFDFGNTLDNQRLPPVTVTNTTVPHYLIGSFKTNAFAVPAETDGFGLCSRFLSSPRLCVNGEVSTQNTYDDLKTNTPLLTLLLPFSTQNNPQTPVLSSNISPTNIAFQQFDACCELAIEGLPKMCLMPSQVLTATAGFDTYIWNTTETTENITITQAGSYNVIAAKACNRCRSYFDVKRYTPKTGVEIGTDTIFICKSTDTLLRVPSGFLLYEWDNGTRDSTRLVDSVGTYWINAIDSCDQVFHDTVRVAFVKTPNIVQSLTDTVFCAGEIVNLQGNSVYQNYTWVSGGLLGCDTCSNTTVTISDTLTQIIVSAQSEGCSATDTLRLRSQPPIRALTENTFLQCFPDNNAEIRVHYQGGGTPPLLYQLNTTPATLDSIFTNLGPNTYIVTALDVNECLWRDTIDIAQPPFLDLQTLPDAHTMFAGDSVRLATVHQGILPNTILWQPEIGLSCTACETPHAKPKKTQKYVVTAQNSDGCTVTDSVLVVVIGDCAVYIPNIFTPNGDGINDAFRLFSGGCGSILVKISIFDRFGEFVFTDGGMPVDDFKGWDGTFKGKICLNGAYACIISIEDPKGIKRTVATDVTIMR